MSSLLARLHAALPERYAITREVGYGGMATVFLGDDSKLGRLVVIKVLHPQLATSLGVERFLREIKTAAALNHPRAVVTDFGIARAVTAASLEPITDTGVIVGTPAYMSPEQAACDPQLDGRSDIYSLGCVVYEMLTGSVPFTGATAQAVIARQSVDAVPPIQVVRPTVPHGLEQAVLRALAKAPADRFATGAQFAAALAARDGVPGEADDRESIAVLPFANLSNDRDFEYFTDGIAEEIINALTQLP